jgi:hypothetical protein
MALRTYSGNVMDCPKCNGLLVSERHSDFFLIFNVWRCYNCGAMIDRTISKNRQHSLMGPTPPKQLARRWVRRPPLPVSR